MQLSNISDIFVAATSLHFKQSASACHFGIFTKSLLSASKTYLFSLFSMTAKHLCSD